MRITVIILGIVLKEKHVQVEKTLNILHLRFDLRFVYNMFFFNFLTGTPFF
jgi:hypothetical protein